MNMFKLQTHSSSEDPPSYTSGGHYKRRQSLKGSLSLHKRRSSTMSPATSPKAAEFPSTSHLTTFHIRLTMPLYQRRCTHKHRSYTVSRAGARTPAYFASFPQTTTIPVLSRPDFLVQRGGDAGPVIGEVRFRGMLKPDRIVLPGRSAGARAESTTMAAEGMWSGRRRVCFMGREWFWKGLGSERSLSVGDGADESLSRGWRCVDERGNVCALFVRVSEGDEVGRLTILRNELSDGEVDGLVVTAMTIFAGEEKRECRENCG